MERAWTYRAGDSGDSGDSDARDGLTAADLTDLAETLEDRVWGWLSPVRPTVDPRNPSPLLARRSPGPVSCTGGRGPRLEDGS